jgi:hypothetical protein
MFGITKKKSVAHNIGRDPSIRLGLHPMFCVQLKSCFAFLDNVNFGGDPPRSMAWGLVFSLELVFLPRCSVLSTYNLLVSKLPEKMAL